MPAPRNPPSKRRAILWMVAGGVPGILIPLGIVAATTRGIRLGPWGSLFPILHLPFLVAGLLASAQATKSARRRYEASPGGLCPRCEHPLPTHTEDPVTCTECGLTLPREEHLRPWRSWFKL